MMHQLAVTSALTYFSRLQGSKYKTI